MFGGTIKSALTHAAIRYDERQSRGKRYNHYALGQYFMQIDKVCADIERGADPRKAIAAAFSGPLLNTMLKAADLDKASAAELRGDGSWAYRPVTASAGSDEEK